jgi:site-specific DNA recombinase
MKTKVQDKKFAVIYYRVSTEDQAAHGISLVQQQQACKQHAKSLGLTVDRLFHDDGVSAKTTEKREGFQTMMRYLRENKKKIGYLIVYRVNRLTRNMNDYTNTMVELARLDIELVSVTEAVNASPEGQYFGNLMAAGAQYENQSKGRVTRDNMKEKFESGYWQWRAPIGYKNMELKTGEKIVVPDSEQAPHIKWIFEEFSKGVTPLYELRKRVNARGFRTDAGKPISFQLISKMLRNRFYAGWMEAFDKEILGKHEPIISDETFSLCQGLLKGHTRKDSISKARTNEMFPLRHFVLCGCCGRPLTGAYSKNKRKIPYPYYRCYLPECTTSTRSIPKAKLESEFAEYLSRISVQLDFSRVIKDVIVDVWQNQYELVNKDRAQLNAEIERLEGEKRKLIDMMKRDLLDDADFRSEFGSVKQKITNIQARLIETKLETFEVDAAVEYVFRSISDLSNLWETSDHQTRLKLLCLIFPEKVTYAYPKFETPRLSPILAIKKTHSESESSLVTLWRIELQLTP